MREFLNSKRIILLFFIVISRLAFAINPAQPFLPSDNIQDPNCLPTDSNCYVLLTSFQDETVEGLDYSTSTGILSLTSGYSIPTVASTTAWDTAIGALGGSALLQNGNSFGTTLTLGTNDSQALSFETNGASAMTILANGNVGIGTTTPSAKLQIIGDVKVGDYIAYAKIGVGGTSTRMNYHGFEDWLVTDTSLSPNLGYASFDARPELVGNAINGHFVGFQSRPIYNSSGNLTDYFDAINTAAVHNGSGTVVNANALKITDIGGTGPVSNNYGIYINNIARGATDNYSIYSNGGKSYFKGRLGVGTTTPESWLHVSGSDMSTSGITAELTGTGANKLTIYPFNDGNTYIQHNGKAVFSAIGSIAPQLTIDTAGFVGVGTLSPLSKMAVVGSSASVGGGAASAGIFHITTGTGNSTANRLMMGVVDGIYSWIQASEPGTAWRNLALQPGGGNVGIGTTTPDTLLTLAGNASNYINIINNNGNPVNNLVFSQNAAASGQSNSILWRSTNGSTFDYAKITSSYGSSFANSYMNFAVANSAGTLQDRLRIDVSGNIGIGTTTPADKLQVFGDVRLGTTGANGCIKDFGGTGIIGSCSSDERLKTNIVDLSDGYLDKMANLKVITYNWNDTAKDLNKVDASITNYGLLAQNVESIFPELVTTDSNGYKQVNYSRIPLYLLKAVQELSKKVAGFSQEFRTQKLCVGETCVTEDQLKQLLQNQNVQYAPTVNTPPAPEPVVEAPAEEIPVIPPPAEEPVLEAIPTE